MLSRSARHSRSTYRPTIPRNADRNRKFADSSLEETVSSEPVSVKNSLLTGKRTGNSRRFKSKRRLGTAKKAVIAAAYGPIPYASLTGNFLRPNRVSNRANREISALIRELD